MNWFVYTDGNPTSNTDPLGLQAADDNDGGSINHIKRISWPKKPYGSQLQPKGVPFIYPAVEKPTPSLSGSKRSNDPFRPGASSGKGFSRHGDISGLRYV